MQRGFYLFVFLLFMLGGVAEITAATGAENPKLDTRPTSAERAKVALVLSGGGARGAAHIGVLRALEEHRIPVDVIIGTSMGAIVGGLYAAGVSPDELESLVRDTDWEAAITSSPRRDLLSYRRKSEDRKYLLGFEMGLKDAQVKLPQGLVSGNKLSFMLRSEVIRASEVSSFDELALPFRAVTTNITTGEMVVVGDGDMATALRASMAVPGVFIPVERDGALLVDGGLVANVPVEIAQAFDVEHVIAVDIGSEIFGIDKLGNIIGLTVQTVNVLIQQNIDRSVAALGHSDVLIKPQLGDFSPANFEEAASLIPLGYQATQDTMPGLAALQVDEKTYAAWLQKQRRDFVVMPDIERIDIEGNQRVSDAQIRARIKLHNKSLLNLTQLEKDLDNIHALDEFESVDFEVVSSTSGTNSTNSTNNTDETRRLVIRVKEKPWGPNYFRFGLKIEDDFEGGNRNNLIASHRWTQVNAYGAEWSNAISIGSERYISSEFYQPVRYSGSHFVAPRLSFSEETIDFFENENRVAEYTLRRADAALDYGFHLRRNTQVRFGAHYDRIDGEARIGDAALVPKVNFNQVGAHVKIRRDSLDKPYFPTRGFLGELGYRTEFTGLNSDVEYESAFLAMSKLWSVGKHTYNAGLELGQSLSGDIPFYEEFYLGGFGRLSGLQRHEIRGDKLALGRLMYSRPINVAVPGRVGFSLETGNTWPVDQGYDLSELRYSGALFWGFDTPLGAVMFSYGYADEGNRAFHMNLGQAFKINN